MRFRLFVFVDRHSKDVFETLWRVHTQAYPTPPGRSAGRPEPTRLWYVRVLDSTGYLQEVQDSTD